jgi:hypothetical protein
VNQCATCDPPEQGVDFCLARDRDLYSDPLERCAAETCAGALANYCGNGARKTSLAWLEMVVASIILTLVVSEALNVYLQSSLATNALKRCLGAGALAGKIQVHARDIREAQRAAAAPNKPAGGLGLPLVAEEAEEAEEAGGDEAKGAWDGGGGVVPLRRPSLRRAESLTTVESLNSADDAPGAARDLDRTDTWCCPCGLRCARARREAHLRECTAFRDAWRSAIVGFLAATGPDESAHVATRAGCSADVALCALAESRGLASLALDKLRHAAYRAKPVLGSLLWADSATWLGGAVGAYLIFVGLAMLFVAKRTSMKLVSATWGLSGR